MKIIFTADDWGLSKPIHQAVTHLHQQGTIGCAGIMMGQPFTDVASSTPGSTVTSKPGFTFLRGIGTACR